MNVGKNDINISTQVKAAGRQGIIILDLRRGMGEKYAAAGI